MFASHGCRSRSPQQQTAPWKPPIAVGLALVAALAAAQGAEAVPRWSPMGPDLILDGQTFGGRTETTGRVNAIAVNPYNPLGDVWIGSAGGGVWQGSLLPEISWRPRSDSTPFLATGDIQLDSCSVERCNTVWVGTGENGIRRDTQYGGGVLRGSWFSLGKYYVWSHLGASIFAHGNITRLLLDPTTADGSRKRLYVAFSTGVTANSTHSTVTTVPPSPLGIYRSVNGGAGWTNVLDRGTPATDLEMDPVNSQILFAAFAEQGIYRSTDGGTTWLPIVNGIDSTDWGRADWVELAVYRTGGMANAKLYAVLGDCPHPHEKGAGEIPHCSPAVYTSNDAGTNWTLVKAAVDPPPTDGGPLSSYVSYTHALTIHPSNPQELWYGGINLYRSIDGGANWETVGADKLHPHHHALKIVATRELPGGYFFLDLSDGGLAIGDGAALWNGAFQFGLAVAQFHSVSAKGDLLFGGTESNGTNVYVGGGAWQHSDDGNGGATLIDNGQDSVTYSSRQGVDPRRCTNSAQCPFTWEAIAGDQLLPDALPASENVSWHPPFAESPLPYLGEHRLYFGAENLGMNQTNGGSPGTAPGWVSITPPVLSGGALIGELNDILNPITAVAVAPTNAARIYIGYYDGKVYTTANATSTNPTWALAAFGLPLRPVTSLAVSPANETVVVAAFAGFGTHSIYRTTNAGLLWSSFDTSADGLLDDGSVNTIAIASTSNNPVWVGTDFGVYQRPSLLGVDHIFTKVTGLPNAAVYDLELADNDQTVYAATHGRGVWRYADTPRLDVFYQDCCYGTSGSQAAPYISVSALGFDPNQASCTMTLYDGGGIACGSSTADAMGATLYTDSKGQLVSDKAPQFTNRAMAWACAAGSCAGVAGTCSVASVKVQCGVRQVQKPVVKPSWQIGPASTLVSYETMNEAGTVELLVLAKDYAGTSTATCEVSVSHLAQDPSATVLGALATAINTDATCIARNVHGTLVEGLPGGISEGDWPTPVRLAVSAPTARGLQLVTEVHHFGKGKLGVHGFGNPAAKVMIVPSLTIDGVSTGQPITVRVTTALGPYSYTVIPPVGASAINIAQAVFDGMTGLDPGTGLPIGGTGGPPRKAEHATLIGNTVYLPHVLDISILNEDSAVGTNVGSSH